MKNCIKALLHALGGLRTTELYDHNNILVKHEQISQVYKIKG